MTLKQITALGLRRHLQIKRPRSFNGEATQAEAIPPDWLAEILRQAIDDRMDEAACQQVLAAEEHAKAVVLGRFGDI